MNIKTKQKENPVLIFSDVPIGSSFRRDKQFWLKIYPNHIANAYCLNDGAGGWFYPDSMIDEIYHNMELS